MLLPLAPFNRTYPVHCLSLKKLQPCTSLLWFGEYRRYMVLWSRCFSFVLGASILFCFCRVLGVFHSLSGDAKSSFEQLLFVILIYLREFLLVSSQTFSRSLSIFVDLRDSSMLFVIVHKLVSALRISLRVVCVIWFYFAA